MQSATFPRFSMNSLTRTAAERDPILVILIASAVYLVLVLFIIGGLIERVGFCLRKLQTRPDLSEDCSQPKGPWSQTQALSVALSTKVCVQLPMFNQDELGLRVIAAACQLNWPRDRFEVQVLDDSSDAQVRAKVDAAVAGWHETGVSIRVLRREGQAGLRTRALERGRKESDAAFFALFDADSVPAPDFLVQTVPKFFSRSGDDLVDLALVQAQRTHLNAAQSSLTLAQTLWIDDREPRMPRT